jgi:hypothetical protein
MTLDRTGITAPRITHAGIAYRNQSPRYDPRSGEGARINGGRFNPPGFPTLYLCETRPCVVAELTRQGTRHVVGVEGLLPRVLYRYELCPIPLPPLVGSVVGCVGRRRAAAGLIGGAHPPPGCLDLPRPATARGNGSIACSSRREACRRRRARS